MINKIAAILGTGLTIIFLLGVTITLNASNMITFFDILPVWIIMGAAIFMMMIEVLEIFDIHIVDTMTKKFLKSRPFDRIRVGLKNKNGMIKIQDGIQVQI